MADATGPQQIEQLVARLASQDAAERQQARSELVSIGSSAVSSLLPALSDSQQHVRWEAAKTLAEIADPAACESLITALADEDNDVRWVAGDAVVALKREAVKPLLTALTKSSQNPTGFYKAAHHVLHELSNMDDLAPKLAGVLKALDQLEPQMAVPGAALKALEELQG